MLKLSYHYQTPEAGAGRDRFARTSSTDRKSCGPAPCVLLDSTVLSNPQALFSILIVWIALILAITPAFAEPASTGAQSVPKKKTDPNSAPTGSAGVPPASKEKTAPNSAPKDPSSAPTGSASVPPASKKNADPNSASKDPGSAPKGTNSAQKNPNSASKEPAQASATFDGKVTSEEGGAPISEAKVVVTRIDKHSERQEYETEYDGKFEFEKLAPGEYTVTASSPGKFSRTEKVILKPGEAKHLDLALENQETVDVLRVSGQRTLIHPEKIGSTTRIDRKFLDQYKSGNDLRQIIESTPGVLPDSYGNLITRGEHNAINYEIDGAILPETAGVLNQAQFANPRSLQQVDVDIGGYQASDGGGPLGAVVRMKSLPIQSKPTFQYGGQLGGPLAGSLHYYASGAASQNKNSIWNKVRMESQGNAVPTSLGIAPPVKHFFRNNRLDLNFLNKVEFVPTEKDKFTFTAGINETFLQIPTSGTSHKFGVRLSEHDRENFLILSYKRRGEKWIDEGNFHIINSFYSQTLRSSNAFDPLPILNGEEPQLTSVAPRASRKNFVVSLQGNIKKTVFKTHHLETGVLTELRPVRTKFGAIYRNANLGLQASSTQEFADAQQGVIDETQQSFLNGIFQQAFDAAIAGGATEEDATAAGEAASFDATIAAQQAGLNAASALPSTVVPYGGTISPFTGTTAGPQFSGEIGKYKGFRYLQSAYFQDAWKPQKGFLKRLTVDAGVRADIYRGVFGNTLKIAQTMQSIPGIQPFSIAPFLTQTVTNAQASGRYGASFVVTKNMVLRGSYSDIFQPPPVDVFAQAPFIGDGPINGIYNGTIRPLQATRGKLVDTSVETQIGPRFATRTNLYYKKLYNFGDSGVIVNTPLYNRVSLSALESYGVETRMDLKPSKEGYGVYGFLSNTIQIAYLKGNKGVNGGIYDVEEGPNFDKYPDHDRRYALQAALGYRTRRNMWCLAELSAQTGLVDRRAFDLFGPHPARTPPLTLIGFNAGWDLPKEMRKKNKMMPTSMDVRIQNILNQRIPLNLGSPFQGTRFQLPLRVLAGVNWEL